MLGGRQGRAREPMERHEATREEILNSGQQRGRYPGHRGSTSRHSFTFGHYYDWVRLHDPELYRKEYPDHQ